MASRNPRQYPKEGPQLRDGHHVKEGARRAVSPDPTGLPGPVHPTANRSDHEISPPVMGPHGLQGSPLVIEQKLDAQHAEIQRLLGENQRLAVTHVALRQELAAAQQEIVRLQQSRTSNDTEKEQRLNITQIALRQELADSKQDVSRLQEALTAIRTERDQHLRTMLDKAARMEAELKAVESLKVDFEKLRFERDELAGRVELLSGEVRKIPVKDQEIASMKREVDDLRQRHQQARMDFELQKKLNLEHLEQQQAMEKNAFSMTREIERLRAELANAERRQHSYVQASSGGTAALQAFQKPVQPVGAHENNYGALQDSLKGSSSENKSAVDTSKYGVGMEASDSRLPKAATANAEPPGEWSKHAAPNGKSFYYNIATGATQWDKPSSMAGVDANVMLGRQMQQAQGTAPQNLNPELAALQHQQQKLAQQQQPLAQQNVSPADAQATQQLQQGIVVKKFLRMFTHGKEEQPSAEDAVAQSMDISTHGKEETDIYCSIREVFKRQSKSPMDQASVTVKLVDELEIKLPAVACEKWNDLDVKERYFWLQKAFPSWSDIDIANIGASMASIRHSRSSKRLRSSTSSDFSSFREVGLHVLQLKPLDDAIVEEIWPLKYWITEYSPGKSMEEMLKLVKFTDCNFELQDKGHCESVCGKGSKPDLLAVLKGHGSATYSTGAIISLHSKGKASRYDNAESVGEALHYGRTFLKEARPMRCFIWVAITDLMDITWLKVSVVDGTDGTRQHSYTRSPGTSKVRESLCAFLVSDPSSLGMNVDMQKEFGMSCDWLWKKVLGWGCTSTVHEVEYKSRRYALKVPKHGTCLANDFAYLSILKDVEGVPKIHSKMGEMLVLQPVGYPFSRSTVKSSGLKCSLVQLVDILEAVHSMGVGNRDIRMENMMIADSSHGDKCKERFYILDWGFAAELGFARSFSGCLYTTSDAVLAQIVKKENLVVYNAADDLVAFIRCMFLFFNEDIVAKLVDLREACISHQSLAAALPAFWGEQMMPNKSWHAIENNAKECNYDAVRSFLVTAADYI